MKQFPSKELKKQQQQQRTVKNISLVVLCHMIQFLRSYVLLIFFDMRNY